MPRPPVVRGSGRPRPTFAAELLSARAQLTVVEAVGLAMREVRRAAGVSQRTYAVSRGWSKTHQHRLEADAATIRLGSVVEALEGTGFELAITAVGADTAVPGRGQRVRPENWADSELIAQDAGGRRFPADREVRRATTAPAWWLWRHGTDALAAMPEWTTESARSPAGGAGLLSVGRDTVATMDTRVSGSRASGPQASGPQASGPQASGPRADRPGLPDGYGIPETAGGQLDWPTVESRLVASMHYWIASVRPDGTPHSVPRWGVWLEGRFWYDGAPTTRHTRNVEVNPAVTLTLESGTEVVIVEGDSAASRADADGLGGRLSEAFGKYADSGYAPGPDSWAGEDGGGLRVITPRRAMAWFDFPKDCTRFTF